jgi:hypothetical protein
MYNNSNQKNNMLKLKMFYDLKKLLKIFNNCESNWPVKKLACFVFIPPNLHYFLYLQTTLTDSDLKDEEQGEPIFDRLEAFHRHSNERGKKSVKVIAKIFYKYSYFLIKIY